MRVVGAYEPRVARAAALAAVVVVLACGGGSSSPAPSGGSGGSAPTGPGGSPPAGDGGSGGGPSAGSGAGSPAAGDGSGVGSSGGGGSGAPAAGGDGGGSSGPGTGAPAAGAGGGGGGGASACADLVPAFGAAVEQQFDTGTHRDCSVATTSASGQVALGIGGSWGGFAGTMFDLYSADGSETGWVDGIVFAFMADQGQDVDPMFHQTSGGYGGIVHPGNANPLPFRTWDANGRLVAEIERFAVSTAPDRNGGSLLLAQAYDPASVTSPPGATRLQWIDAAGELTRAVTLDRDARLVISNWGTGHVVVVVPSSPGSARWFDESGSPLTPWFDIGDVSSAPSLHLLLDGTVAIRAGGRWTVALTDGSTSAGAVPAWLASRPSTRLATIRQGRAYAVLPMGGTPGDATSFEIVAASGQGCGSFSIPPAAEPPGVVKKPRRLDVGQDGTLLQQSAVLLTPNPFGIHCAFRWWPKLLQ